MQGQGSNKATTPALDQHKVDFENASERKGNDVMNWIGQSRSSINTQNQINYVQLLSEHDDAPTGRNKNIDLNATCQGNSNSQEMGATISLNPSKPSGEETDQRSPGSGASNPILISSGISGYVLEENDGRQGNSSEGRHLYCKRRTPELSFSPLLLRRSSSSSALQARSSDQQAVVAQENSGSSIKVLGALNNHPNVGHFGRLNAGLEIVMGAASARHRTSTTAGAVLEDGISAATLNHQSSSVEANALEGASQINQTTSTVAGNGFGAGLGAATGTNQASIWAGQSDDYQRNIRPRRNANQQSFEPDYGTMWNPYARPHETNMSCDPFDDILLGKNASALDLPAMHSLPQGPSSYQNRQVSQGVPMSRASGSSSSSAHAVNGGYHQHQDETLRNRILPFGFERGNLPHMGTSRNFGLPGNARNGSNSNVGLPFAPTSWSSNPNRTHLYSHTFPDTGRDSEFRGRGSYLPIHGVSGGSVRRDNVRPAQSERRVRARLMQPAVGYHDLPSALRSLIPTQRRRMPISGVHNALTLVRRRGALRLEDVMVIDHSVLLRQPVDEEDDDDDDDDDYDDDVNEDMRLDVENMSYEELLALEEHIGIVNTGLSEEAIMAGLGLRKHQSITIGSPVNNEPCCICQEEYAEGEDLGKLDCGHDFHANCIKQWLVLKNVCPICKLTALAGRKRES